MRLAIDATSLIGTRTGIGTATLEVLRRLPRPDLDVTAFAVSRRGARALRGDLPDGVGAIRRPMVARPLRSCWRRSDRPVIEHWTGPVDVVWGPNFVVPPTRRAAEVVTVHDLTFLEFPEMCTPDTLQVPDLLGRAIARGAFVHTVSHAVADAVRDAFIIDPDRVVAIPNGAPERRDAAEVERLARRGTATHGEQYLAFVGTLEPRKDLPSLIAAFDRLATSRPGLRLVLAGPDGWGASAVHDAILRAHHADRIVLTGWLDEEARDAVLAGATAFVYPSVLEGFGLPPLEALSLGTPVIATHVGALPEVLGDAAQWVEPGSPDELADAIAAVLDDPTRADALVRQGPERLAAFDWRRSADQLVELFGRAASERRPTLP